jgi:rhamnosyltransferase subunit B
MARIVITTFGSYGDVFPYIGLALGLRARGHQPRLAMQALYRDLIGGEGLDFHPIRPDLDPGDRALAARIMDPARGSDAIFSELLIPSLPHTYEDLTAAAVDADLILTHPASLAGPIVAAKRQLRWASSVLAPLSFFSTTDPMVPPPAPWVHAVTSRSALLSRGFTALTDRMTQKWAAPVQEFRATLGLPPGGNPITHGQHSPHLVLALFSSVLATPQPDWPPRAIVTGPVLYNGREADVLAPALAAFLDAGPPPVVFTLGTSAVFAAGSFYDVSAKAAGWLGRRAVLLVGRQADNRPIDPGRDIMAVDFAPHRALFARAAAIVHQGGAGTLHQALASGHPMLVVPHAHDQPDNAHRAQRVGVARTLYPKRYAPEALVRELAPLVDDPAYQRRAAEVGAVVRAEDGVGRACDAIERLLRGQP